VDSDAFTSPMTPQAICGKSEQEIRTLLAMESPFPI
jgi:hypothetical protein